MNQKMNQRISEIMRNHGLQKNISEDCQHRIEMLAELIVRECSKISEDDITDGDACCTNTAYRIARRIKQRFGVE